MLEIVKRIAKYSKTERIQRLIEISVKGENATAFEQMECMMIQFIRQENGEIDEVKKNRELQEENFCKNCKEYKLGKCGNSKVDEYDTCDYFSSKF